MDCETFREAVLADPAAPGTAEMDAHESACAPCAAYADRARRAEALISDALRFDVAEAKAAATNPPAQNQDDRQTSWLSAGLAATVAAVVVMALGRGVGVVPNPGPELTALASDVAEHWIHEPHSWVVTGYRAPQTMVSQVLAGKANLATDALPPISYVHSCYFRGQWVPHLVFQGQNGPVMVLLLRDEKIMKPQPIEVVEEGLEGVVIPHGDGSVAILGEAGESLQPLEKALTMAVEWSI